ncbi:hypothetical protein FQR65_LT12731 [Abscondita terminalis]|nr:hypothetical protein FQR65_LT12731 [Abscondita terminalis]
MESTFTLIDYLLFAGMLLSSLVIGVYFGFCGKTQTADEYLLGGKSMKVLPVGLSIIATHISGLTLLGVPSEVYLYGANYFWICVVLVPTYFLTSYVYLPVLMKLQVPSVFEYIKLRFGKYPRLFASFLFTIQVLVYIPIVAFIPAIALSQATSINVHLITPVVGIICVFYTTIGGFKAVIWTDAFQFVGIIGSVIAIFCLGVISVGGFETIWNRSLEGQRLDIFEVDPTVRNSFWSLFVGSTFHYMCSALLNQSAMQKFLAVPTPTHARKVILIFCLGFMVIILLVTCIGVIAYAKYWDCDPLSSNKIHKLDQLIPLMTTEVAGKSPGIPGMFIAGVFCASLSILSVSFNSIACSVYEDFLTMFLPEDISENAVNRILKLIILVTGVVCIALMFAFEDMTGVFDFSISIQAITNGPLLGLFTLGILCPWANALGSLCGGIIGLTFISVMVIGNQWYKSKGFVDYCLKPVSTNGCSFPYNKTNVIDSFEGNTFVLFALSNWYNTLIGATVVVVIASFISCLTNNKNNRVDVKLLSPSIRRLVSNT